jgi:hypothetical protein
MDRLTIVLIAVVDDLLKTAVPNTCEQLKENN